ncbi:MAG TPA: peptidoglycan-binding domain-containing protein [Thermoanaerobaculia bacterium]|jgi:N-acetylmuramoyl-L-alanine amidase
MPFHDVKQGETLLGLASAQGLESFQTILDAPENAQFKEKRKDPGILKEGDRVFIPNKVMKHHPSAVDATHSFGVKRPKAWLRLAVHDAEGVALAGKKYELAVGSTKASGTLAANGIVEAKVAIDAKSGTLKVWLDETTVETWELKIGFMDPIDEISGVQARLNNLGYDCGEPDGTENDATKTAVRAFQERVGLQITGTIDDALRTKLASYYDPAQDETSLDAKLDGASEQT